MKNYEKAYNEALERAKQVYKESYNINHKTDIETIFPELKESEGERIRKTLIRVLNENVGNGIEKYGAKLEDALAWLEKQGEKKPTWNKEDERLRYSCIKHIEEELQEISKDKFGHSEIISDLKDGCRERINWLKSLKKRLS